MSLNVTGVLIAAVEAALCINPTNTVPIFVPRIFRLGVRYRF